ncbi:MULTISPECIES: hypothetical protein [unclassified Lysobacter]|uniref:hypothetical protein n=1 Tax=unclassified Lysobacter TaxID=2635362 RepID=UPI001C23C001|nr:hypothetical protein [Lysobacter sp. MMG2]
MDFQQSGALGAWCSAALRWSQRLDQARIVASEYHSIPLGNEASRSRAPRR